MKRIMFLTVVVLAASAGMAYAAGSITGRSIKDRSITGKDIKNKSLTTKQFKGSVRGPRGESGISGPVGPEGAAGAEGAEGAEGPAGSSAVTDISVTNGSLLVPAGEIDGGTLLCPDGEHAISGGFGAMTDDSVVFLSVANDDRSGWIVALDNSKAAIEGEMAAQVLCSGSGETVAGARQTQTWDRSDAKLDRLVAKRRASHR